MAQKSNTPPRSRRRAPTEDDPPAHLLSAATSRSLHCTLQCKVPGICVKRKPRVRRCKIGYHFPISIGIRHVRR
jgi:hypothetical protein